ncbi:MAG: ABC transporter permease [Saprospiraceae bacterium]|nr:ABC transporter permease [Saprospiraceae bacterium]
MLTLKLAWKNIWRSRTRSLVVVASIIIGVWSVIFLMSFSLGMGDSYLQSALKNEYGHMQVHHPNYKDDQEAKFTFEEGANVGSIAGVKAYSPRVLSNGMLSTGHGARGVIIKGIDPELEDGVSGIKAFVKEGEYLETGDQRSILVSQKLTEKFKLGLRSKVVLTFQDENGDMQSSAYRVKGIYNSGNAMVDEMRVFVDKQSLAQLMFKNDSLGNRIHEMAFMLTGTDQMDTVQSQLAALFPGELVENYKQLAPDLALMETQIKTSGYIFIFIFMLALIFGIINTMLMAVLERYRELGMLQAIGMGKPRVFSMVVMETFLLSMVGVPIGYLLGYISVKSFGTNGLDLTAFSKGNEMFGMSSTVYPIMDINLFIQLGVAVAITSLVASIYPALKAIRLKPVEAIRKL